jgi:hypothetical protein
VITSDLSDRSISPGHSEAAVVSEVGIGRGSEPPAVLTRALTICAGIGIVVGGIIETVPFPVVGTFFGAIVGGIAGAAVGLAIGAVLICVTELTRSNWAAGAASGLTSAACATAIGSNRFASWWSPHGSAGWLVVAASAAVASLLGPIVAHGARPVRLTRRTRDRRVCAVVQRAVVVGAIGGGGLGAIAGLIIGVVAYLPTAPFAVIEGGIFGVVSGIVIALLVAAALLAPKLRVQR